MVASRRLGPLLLAVVLTWAPGAAADSIRQVSLETADLVYDPVGDRLYLSIPSGALIQPNRVVRINPATGTIEAGVSVGENPGRLVISPDGQYLYVAVENGAAVQRITVATLTAEPPFPLGSDPFFGAHLVEDMAVVPGSPRAIAVSRMYAGVSPRHAGVAIYDDGVQRPVTTAGHTGSNVIEFGSATRLYGYNTETTELGFRRMIVDASGVTVLESTRNLVFAVDIIADGGRVYATSGQVIDGEARSLVGQLAGDFQGLVRPDASVGRLFGLHNDGQVSRLLVWDLATFRLVGAIEIRAAARDASGLIRWGADGLAFRTDSNQLFLIQTSLVASANADLAIAVIGPEVAPVDRPFAYALVITNNGPAEATEVLVQEQLPAGTMFVSAAASQGSCTGTASVLCTLGTLARGAVATVNIVVQATAVQTLTAVASVSATTTDPHPDNNIATLQTAVEPAGITHTVRRLNLLANDLVHDPATGRIHASLPGDASAGGNSVVAIDPTTGALAPPVFVGSEPGTLALSDDGTFLYVALDGAAAVRRVDVTSGVAGLQFWLGADSFTGPFFAGDMAVAPGDPRAVAVARRNHVLSPDHEGVAIYDDGVMRAATTPDHEVSTVIEFAQAPARLYGYNNSSTEFGFRRMAVDAGGVFVVDVTSDLIQGFGTDIVFDAGLLYTTTGLVIDPEARLLVGSFESASGLVRPDAGLQRVFFFDGAELRAFDTVTREPIGSVAIDGVIGQPGSLVRWGVNGLAFRTTGGQVFLIETSLAPRDAVDLAVMVSDAPDPVSVSAEITFTIAVQNRGPNAATGVVLRDPLPSTLTAVSATASQGACVVASTVSCELGDLGVGASASATIVARAIQFGMVTNRVTVTADQLDLDPTDNTASVVTTVQPRQLLTVTRIGTGQGTVTSAPAGVDCGTTCTASFDTGAVVHLAPQAELGSFFAGWTGDADCTDGQVTMTEARTCTARFSRRPDLVVLGVSGPTIAGVGQRISVADRVGNQAPAPATAGPFTVGLYLSAVQGFNRSQATFLGARQVAGLSAGTSSPAHTTVTIPANAVECTCYLVAVVDDADTVPETDETNNVRVAAVAITIVRPDLTVAGLTGPAIGGTGRPITLTSTVRNAALPPAAAHAFTVGLYLSTEPVFVHGQALRLGQRNVAGLAAATTSTGSTTVTLPTDLIEGTYYLFAVADDGATVAESDETNNVGGASGTLRMVRPDLTVGAVSASLTAARTITISAVLQNRGISRAAPTFRIGYYLSPSEGFNRSNARLLEQRLVFGLAARTSTTVVVTLPIPGDIPGGPYFAVVVVDDFDAVPESDELNNVGVATAAVTIVDPDLTAIAVSGPATAGAGLAIPVVTSIRNLAGASGPFGVGIYLSPTPVFDRGSSRLLGGPRTAGIRAGQTWTTTTSVTVPADVAEGDHYLALVADDPDALLEVTETNNVVVATTPLRVVRPDLVVAAVSAPVAAGTRQTIGVSVTARNLATSPGHARAFTIGIYLSTPTEQPGPRIGQLRVAGLAAGQGLTASVSATVPPGAEPGFFTVTARVDDDEALHETDEGNNALAASRPLQVIRPDLEALSLTAPAVGAVGQTISVTTRVRNAAAAPAAAPAFTVDFWLAVPLVDPTAPCVSVPCPRHLGTRSVGPLGPGAVATLTPSFTLPADFPPGTYEVVAVVDSQDHVIEHAEGNNRTSSSTLSLVHDVRGTTPVSASGQLGGCTDPSLGGAFVLPSGTLAITTQTRDRFTGAATFVVSSGQLTLRFVFRLNGTVDTLGAVAGSYTATVTFDGVVGLAGDGAFMGTLTSGAAVDLEGELHDQFDQCHMTLHIAGPAAVARAP